MTKKLNKILILGLGNTLMSDDGLGVVVAENLRKATKAKSRVEILSAGTAIFNFLQEMGTAHKVIAIDAITGNKTPGTIYRINGFDINSDLQQIQSHGCSFPELATLSKELTGLPFTAIIYGIEPLYLGPGLSISPVVQTAIKRLIPIITGEIEKL